MTIASGFDRCRNFILSLAGTWAANYSGSRVTAGSGFDRCRNFVLLLAGMWPSSYSRGRTTVANLFDSQSKVHLKVDECLFAAAAVMSYLSRSISTYKWTHGKVSEGRPDSRWRF